MRTFGHGKVDLCRRRVVGEAIEIDEIFFGDGSGHFGDEGDGSG